MRSPALGPEWLEKLAALEGLISADVGATLADLAAGVPRSRAIVELGSYRGKSTAYLAAGAAVGNGAPVFAVDPWDTPGNRTGRFGFADPATRAAFMAQLSSVDLLDRVTPLRGFSTDVARHWLRPIGLLYVDGSHTEADVRADVEAWAPFLEPGAVIAFDDYRTDRNPGVAAVVDRMRKGSAFRDWIEGPSPLVYGVRA
jgi:cephalosporin hydroxylase